MILPRVVKGLSNLGAWDSASRTALTLSDGFDLSPKRFFGAHSCRRLMVKLRTTGNFAARLSACFAAFFRCLHLQCTGIDGHETAPMERLLERYGTPPMKLLLERHGTPPMELLLERYETPPGTLRNASYRTPPGTVWNASWNATEGLELLLEPYGMPPGTLWNAYWNAIERLLWNASWNAMERLLLRSASQEAVSLSPTLNPTPSFSLNGPPNDAAQHICTAVNPGDALRLSLRTARIGWSRCRCFFTECSYNLFKVMMQRFKCLFAGYCVS